MIFDYKPEKVYIKSIEIDDIGNTCLRCTDKDYVSYYIATQTIMGKTYILQLGPVIPDIDINAGGLEAFTLSYYNIDYKEKAIIKVINQLIQNPVRKIEEVEEVDLQEALEAIPNKEAFIPA